MRKYLIYDIFIYLFLILILIKFNLYKWFSLLKTLNIEEDLIFNGNTDEVKISKYYKNKWTENINRLKLKNIFIIY